MKKNLLFLLLLALSSCTNNIYYLAQAEEDMTIYPMPYKSALTSDHIAKNDSFFVYSAKRKSTNKIRTKDGVFYVLKKYSNSYKIFKHPIYKNELYLYEFMYADKKQSNYQYQNTNSYQNTSSEHNIQTGPRGGRYYINKNGNKTYIRSKH